MDLPTLDLLLFGATGTSGFFCIPYLYKLTKENGRNLTWGVSGRSENKLRETLKETEKQMGIDLSHIPIVIADVSDRESLKKMAERTRVLINCCGPYAKYGYPVVEACIAAGTHHVDITAEPEYIETMYTKYHAPAQEKGVYIVMCCGVDTIPSDLGLVYLEQQFDGVLNSVVAYFEGWYEDVGPGPIVGCGTWNSLVHALYHGTRYSRLKKRMFPQPKPATFLPELKVKYTLHRNRKIGGWSLFYFTADKVVMRKTQEYLYENENKRPVQIETLSNDKSFLRLIVIFFAIIVWLLFVQFRCGRNLMINYPAIFTFGLFRKGQFPSERALQNTFYRVTFYGEGWKEKLPNKNDQYDKPPNKNILASFTARNPAYGVTCLGIVGSAIAILTEKDKLPSKGGVYSTGSAFGKTSLMKTLIDHKTLEFEILKSNDL
ncbi:saccharopine dehydrogenase-like oxidoreductase [Diorhabda sublineata]|uniref:saccharopine dehydrogenase-like oxidoreductase n=1 Tax=Diorhabda sublineata TaxID=1163346 RepID=UPI0024E1265B|nr:saccharopine dehydrogenase-like oxidoreductase [Diorhabda sublineata]